MGLYTAILLRSGHYVCMVLLIVASFFASAPYPFLPYGKYTYVVSMLVSTG